MCVYDYSRTTGYEAAYERYQQLQSDYSRTTGYEAAYERYQQLQRMRSEGYSSRSVCLCVCVCVSVCVCLRLFSDYRLRGGL